MNRRREESGIKQIIWGIIGFVVFCFVVYKSMTSRNIITGMDIRVTDVEGQVYMNSSTEVLSAGERLTDKDHIVVNKGSMVEIEVEDYIKVRVNGYADFCIDELKLSESRNFQLDMASCDTTVEVLQCTDKKLELATRNAIATVSNNCKLRLIYVGETDTTYALALEGTFLIRCHDEDQQVSNGHGRKVRDLLVNPIGDILEGMLMDNVEVDLDDYAELDADLYITGFKDDLIEKYSEKYGAEYIIDENNEEYQRKLQEFLENNSRVVQQ